MRVRLHLTSGAYLDAEKYSDDLGTTWKDITPQVAAASLGAETGFTVVHDLITEQWRGLRLATIAAIGPAGDTAELIEREVERRIQERLAGQLPQRVVDAIPAQPEVVHPPGPPQDPPRGPDNPGRPPALRMATP